MLNFLPVDYQKSSSELPVWTVPEQEPGRFQDTGRCGIRSEGSHYDHEFWGSLKVIFQLIYAEFLSLRWQPFVVKLEKEEDPDKKALYVKIKAKVEKALAEVKAGQEDGQSREVKVHALIYLYI